MASRVVGLDIGTHAARAVELSFGRGVPVLRRFGQVALPYGAVVAGEVVDPTAVAAAVRRLWRETGLRTRQVVVGVANQRVVARTAELPAMADDELRSALRFQVQDLIPIPVDEAVLDYQVLERVVGPEQQELMRIILVAAHRDMIQSLLAAVEGAGLSAERIDAVPFALIRALHTDALGLGDDDLGDLGEARGPAPAEAIVDIGAGVTNVVVHESGVPRFVRTLATGGNAITAAIAEELDIDVDAAEDLKRRADTLSTDADEARAGQIVAAQLSPLVEDVRGSLDFYLAQADDGALGRVLLTGGSSRLPDLSQRLGGLLGVPVEPALPLTAVQMGDTGLSDDTLRTAQPLMAVAVGLALSGEPVDGGIRRITLLPGDVGVRRVERRRAVAAYGAVAALAVALLLVWLVRGSQVDDEQQQADEAEDRTAQLQAEVASLQDAGQLQTDIANRRQQATAVLTADIAWTRLLQEIATVIPNDVWLTSFQGQGGASGAVGTVSFSGQGFDQTSAARWLLRVGELDSLSGLWLPSSTLSDPGAARPLITFSSDAELTPAARSDRAERFLEEQE